MNDNRAVGPQDFDTFSIPVPVDSRLPISGQTLGGLLNVKPAKFGLIDNFVTFADNYGKQIRHYNGIALNANVRTTTGITAQGGFSLGRIVEDNCDLAEQLPELFVPGNGVAGDGAITNALGGLRSLDFCHLTTPLQPVYTGLATYTIPRVEDPGGRHVSSKAVSNAAQLQLQRRGEREPAGKPRGDQRPSVAVARPAASGGAAEHHHQPGAAR